MDHHRRNLPHFYPPESTLFVTWRLFGSLPQPTTRLTDPVPPDPGKAFVLADRALDRAACGPLWLKEPVIAEVVMQALKRGADEYRSYDLFAWVVMPNHVHLVVKPIRPLPDVTRWIKGSTTRAANLMLGRTGTPFWRYESYDHCIRNSDERNRVIRYVERNPVSAGLVQSPDEWPWSSARQANGLLHIAIGPR